MVSADRLLTGFFYFFRSLIGIVIRPYETYRGILLRSDLYETLGVWILVWGYFVLASLVKTAAFRPFLLTQKFIMLGSAAFITYIGVVYVLYYLSRMVRGAGELRSVAIGWAYSLIPSVIWFFTTSVLYIILPPPRTERLLGITYSVIYLLFSLVLLYWKGMLFYLTLRFGMKLDFTRIVGVFSLFLPIAVLYSIFMYRLGVFKVPFL